jgi:hypothetical protein
MLDALAEASQDEEDDSFEEDVEAADNEEVRNSGSPKDKRVLTGKPKYYSKQQQLELVLAAQELLKYGEHDKVMQNLINRKPAMWMQKVRTSRRMRSVWSC